MKRRIHLQDIPRQNVERIRIWNTDLDHDGEQDLLLHLSGLQKEFWVVRGRSAGEKESAQRSLDRVDVGSIADVRFADLDRDGVEEVFVLDRDHGRIGWFHPLDRMSADLETVWSEENIVAFDIADVDADGTPEVISVTRRPDLLHIRRIPLQNRTPEASIP